MNRKQTVQSLVSKMISDRPYRMVLFAAAAFCGNVLYAVYHGVLGVINQSLWFTAMCAFYSILAVMRFSAALCSRRKKFASSADAEYFVMKLTGVLLSAMSLLLAAIIYISLSQNIAVRHGEIIMITIATYTFSKITIAIVNAVKYRKSSALLLGVIRKISYADVAASVLTLQRSMLVSFEPTDDRQIEVMTVVSGAAVCVFVLLLGISMLITIDAR